MRTYSLIFLLVLAYGCQDVKMPDKPENLISEDKMVEVLTEAYLSNAARSINNRMIRIKGIKLDSIIYEKYDIDSTQFVKSHAYYTSELGIYRDLFTRVEANLVKMKTFNDSLNEIDKRRRDSLAEIIKDSVKRKRRDTIIDTLAVKLPATIKKSQLVEAIQDSVE